MGLEMKEGEKIREGLCTDTSHDAKHIHGGKHQHTEPPIAFRVFPEMGFGILIALDEPGFITLDAAPGNPGQLSDGANGGIRRGL